MLKNGQLYKNKRQGFTLSFIFIHIITFHLLWNSVKWKKRKAKG